MNFLQYSDDVWNMLFLSVTLIRSIQSMTKPSVEYPFEVWRAKQGNAGQPCFVIHLKLDITDPYIAKFPI